MFYKCSIYAPLAISYLSISVINVFIYYIYIIDDTKSLTLIIVSSPFSADDTIIVLKCQYNY